MANEQASLLTQQVITAVRFLFSIYSAFGLQAKRVEMYQNSVQMGKIISLLERKTRRSRELPSKHSGRELRRASRKFARCFAKLRTLSVTIAKLRVNLFFSKCARDASILRVPRRKSKPKNLGISNKHPPLISVKDGSPF
jgi:hypothetical protein